MRWAPARGPVFRSTRALLLILGLLAVPARLATPARLAAPDLLAGGEAGSCAICDGSGRLPCPKCGAEQKPCAECEGKGKAVCPRCGATGKDLCPRCEGDPAPCASCSGNGRVWVPRKYVWGARGVRKVEPAHWAGCAACNGSGKNLCGLCGGKGQIGCPTCRGTGSITCPTCKGKKPRGGDCRACAGKGWIPCPGRPEEHKGKAVAEDAESGRTSPADLRELGAPMAVLDRRPLLVSLRALDRISSLKSPLRVLVFREALARDHPWVRVLALDGIASCAAKDIAECGGAPLAAALVREAGSVNRVLAGRAREILEKLFLEKPDALHRDAGGTRWALEARKLPAGESLPSEVTPRGEANPPAPPEDGAAAAGRGPEADENSRTGVGPSSAAESGDELRFGPEALSRQGVDIVWAIDASGSVRPHIRRVTGCARIATRLLSGLLGNVRAGIVAYRDRVEAKLPVAADIDAFSEALRKIVAAEGGDFPEGVDLALRVALDPKAMEWRPEACVAIVVAGDEGPTPARARALVDHVRKLRKEDARFATHSLLIGDVETPLPAHRFFLDLAEAGGGEVVPLIGTEDVLGDLCAALLGGEDRKAVRRIVRAIARVEGWDKARDLEPAGNAR